MSNFVEQAATTGAIGQLCRDPRNSVIGNHLVNLEAGRLGLGSLVFERLASVRNASV
jgi:hypothetical protein